MELTFLGTGGSQPIPLPFCDCGLCVEAREKGAPYTRCGFSLYLSDLNAMVDASEYAPMNANRWHVPTLEYLFLTHWHPDHTHGLRVLAMRAADAREGETFIETNRRTAPTIITTRAVYERSCETVGLLRHLVENREWADIHFLEEEPFEARGIRVEAIPYALRENGPEDATGFIFRRDGTALAVVSDDARYLDEARLPDDPDAVVFECGHFTQGPDGERLRSAGVEADDLSHEEVRERVQRVGPHRAYLSHISHHYARSYDHFREREQAYDRIRFAYDGLTVTI